MILDADQIPPLAVLGDDIPAVMFYENEDGEYYVPVEEEPDQRRAWLRAEASASVALVPDGRQTLPVADCESDHHCEQNYGCDGHPECPKVPCPPAVPTLVWTFLNVADNDEFRAGIAYPWASQPHPPLTGPGEQP